MEFDIQLRSFIPQYIQALSGLESVIRQEANELLQEAKNICPSRTGKLRNSGFTEIQRNGPEVQAIVGFTAPYAARVESRVHYLQLSYMSKENEIINSVMNYIKSI